MTTFAPTVALLEERTAERDRARETAARLADENLLLMDALMMLRSDAPHIRPEDVVERIDQIVKAVRP